MKLVLLEAVPQLGIAKMIVTVDDTRAEELIASGEARELIDAEHQVQADLAMPLTD